MHAPTPQNASHPADVGSNDWPHNTGPGWEANFSHAITEFALTAAGVYGNRKLPIFVAQGPFAVAGLGHALNVSVAAINAAGGNAVYLNLQVLPIDGCGGHPGVVAHAEMAAKAIPQIASKMGW